MNDTDHRRGRSDRDHRKKLTLNFRGGALNE